jgi:hypothetical protein
MSCKPRIQPRSTIIRPKSGEPGSHTNRPPARRETSHRWLVASREGLVFVPPGPDRAVPGRAGRALTRPFIPQSTDGAMQDRVQGTSDLHLGPRRSRTVSTIAEGAHTASNDRQRASIAEGSLRLAHTSGL